MIDYEEDEKFSGPMMQRTKAQLGTAYAPGAIFTFESNLVICRSKPASSYTNEQMNGYAKDLILMSIDEVMTKWLEAGMRITDSEIKIEPEMCIDPNALRDNKSRLTEAKALFAFAQPSQMGYEPDLLSFVCTHCRDMRNFSSLRNFEQHSKGLAKSCEARDDGGACSWQQLDIVFIHPNGNYTAPLPYIRKYDEKNGMVTGLRRCNCGSYEVKLIRHGAQIGKYRLRCAECKTIRTGRSEFWLQNDKEYLELIKTRANEHPYFARMKPISARSNSVFYARTDMVIDFSGEDEKLEMISSNNNVRITQWLAEKFELPVTKVSEGEMKKAVTEALGVEAWRDYEGRLKALDMQRKYLDMMSEQEKEFLRLTIIDIEEKLNQIEREWEKQGVIKSETAIPESIREMLNNRRDYFAPKYDPFRLSAEYDVLKDKVITTALMENGLAHYTALDKLDEHIGPDDPELREQLKSDHRKIMDQIGIEDMGLVRDFRTITYSYGYTRVAATPVTSYINDKPVPVRLRLFEKTKFTNLTHQRHPIFVLNQSNEAIYVKLNEVNVRSWIESLDTSEKLTDELIGLQYLKNIKPMSQYLPEIHTTGEDKPAMSLAIYTLVHTYAHHVMNAVSEYSGLGSGSLSEYLFPGDLSFVIYRKGMTMDMGNLTSIIRNNAPAFLEYLHTPRNLSCGSGSLCTSRGGACPDCLLIHEMSCIAQNNLLSRSVLIGNGHPGKYGFKEPIPGYLEIAFKAYHAKN
ncbi:MAG TPA: hypothetical protein ENI26_13175 [Methylophaga aminisulfidivorans]|uniref:DUF1998 domain-containing protein n=2 Tax=root TaxID=1 RepID=A0A7C1VS39_9GAMM|nr:hypothetical protein [Methylophaga aminisulfidivorans]